MNIHALPFCTTNWAEVPPTEHKGTRRRPLAHPAVRGSAGANGGVLPGYLADHWCSKGHVLLCLEGSCTPSCRMAASSP
jgi:hypothetical protein